MTDLFRDGKFLQYYRVNSPRIPAFFTMFSFRGIVPKHKSAAPSMSYIVGIYYASQTSETVRGRSMPANWVTYSSYGQERDMLSILMDSNLYFDLSLQERRVLLKHIVKSYHSPAVSASEAPLRIEKSTALSALALSLGPRTETL
jgi:hypothetical protein